MPIIKSAAKKLRSDLNKKRQNDVLRNLLNKSLKTIRKNPTTANLSKTMKIVDKLAKKNLIHKNKASRIKSSLSKLIKPAKKTAPSK